MSVQTFEIEFASSENEFEIDMEDSVQEIEIEEGNITNIGTKDYKQLYNKPSIEGVTLVNNKTFEDLGAKSLTNLEIEKLINLQV